MDKGSSRHKSSSPKRHRSSSPKRQDRKKDDHKRSRSRSKSPKRKRSRSRSRSPRRRDSRRSKSPRSRSRRSRSPRRRSRSPRRRSASPRGGRSRDQRSARERKPSKETDRKSSRDRKPSGDRKSSPEKKQSRDRRSSPQRKSPERRSSQDRKSSPAKRRRSPSPARTRRRSRTPPQKSRSPKAERRQDPVRSESQHDREQRERNRRPTVQEAESTVRDPPRLPTAHRVYPRMEPDSSHHSYQRDRSRSPQQHRAPPREMEYKYAQQMEQPSEEELRREDQQREAARIADIFQVEDEGQVPDSYRGRSEPSVPSRLDEKERLNDRFSSKAEKPFVPKENITVGIERNIEGNAPAVFREYNPEKVFIWRPKSEGKVPLFKREEFLTREEVSERRVVKVIKDEERRTIRRHSDHERENFEVRRDKFETMEMETDDDRRPSLSDRWREGDLRRQEVIYSPHPVRESRDRQDSRRVPVQQVTFSAHQLEQRGQDHRHVVPRDEDRSRRQSGSNREEERSRRGAPEREDREKDKRRERFEKDPMDLRHSLVRRHSGSDRDRGRPTDIRDRLGDRNRTLSGGDTGAFRTKHPGGPEDFSRRPDKYRYQEWLDNPEMIPKGPSYYEHDNRDSFEEWRGRGRGFRGRGFRGRGFFPFRGRGRGFYNRQQQNDGLGEWKHDKFHEIEKEEKQEKSDEKPSSTSEK